MAYYFGGSPSTGRVVLSIVLGPFAGLVGLPVQFLAEFLTKRCWPWWVSLPCSLFFGAIFAAVCIFIVVAIAEE